MTIAVVGATGFIGRHVVAALAQSAESEVVAVSRSGNFDPQWPTGVRSVAFDVHADKDAFQRLGRPDTLIHLAWGGLPNYTSRRHFEVEAPAQYRFIEAMTAAGVARVVVAGTCYEYGMRCGELDETLVPAPANSYALAKATLLQQLEFLSAECGFEFTWARLFYMWGEGQATSSLYPLLIAAIERGDVEFPMSLGEQLRDFLPVEEVAGILMRLARRDVGGGVVNVCSGRPVSVRRLVESWVEARKATISLNLGHYPYPAYEPLAFWGSRRKLDLLLADSAHERCRDDQ